MRAIIIAAAMLFFAPTAALADEYNFTVPVRIVNAVNVSGASVECSVAFREGDSFPRDDGRSVVPLTGNSFTGNVAVRVTTIRPRSSQEMWSCNLRLAYSGVGHFPNGTPATVSAWYRTQSGHTVESITTLVQGGRIP